MKRPYLTLLAALLFVCSTIIAVSAQSTGHRDGGNESKEKAKGEVDHMIEELSGRNEHVAKICLENCTGATEVTEERFIEKVTPVYPPIARAAHATGEVVVQVLVDEQGNVLAAQAISGHPLLQATSVKAARESKFKPYIMNGSPVKVTGSILYKFKM